MLLLGQLGILLPQEGHLSRLRNFRSDAEKSKGGKESSNRRDYSDPSKESPQIFSGQGTERSSQLRGGDISGVSGRQERSNDEP